jgi:hypothetical protein
MSGALLLAIHSRHLVSPPHWSACEQSTLLHYATYVEEDVDTLGHICPPLDMEV